MDNKAFRLHTALSLTFLQCSLFENFQDLGMLVCFVFVFCPRSLHPGFVKFDLTVTGTVAHWQETSRYLGLEITLFTSNQSVEI